MANLFDNIKLLVSASLNDLVNKALRANSPAVLDEYIRRADESMDTLLQTMAEVKGNLVVETRKNRELQAAIGNMDADITVLLKAGKQQTAGVLVKSQMMKKTALQKSDVSLADSQADLSKLTQAQAVLQAKIDELKTTRDNVQQALEIAKTKGKMVRTIDDMSDILKQSGAAGIADWAEKVKAQSDARLDMTLQKNGSLLNPEDDPAVAAELARRMAALNADQSAATP